MSANINETSVKPKVSVIMPAYNCACFIVDTIGSVLCQTLSQLELIVVDDGSTDDTPRLLSELAAKDCRIQIVTVKNGGPSNARNVGISKAAGEYLYFMDSDDLIMPNMLECMYSCCREHSLDVCACGYQMENISTKTPHIKEFNYPSFVAHTADDFRRELMPLIKAHLMYVVWNKLFSKSFIEAHGIRFLDYKSGEDRLFCTSGFQYVERFAFIDKIFYRYFLRGQATLASRYLDNRFEAAVKCHEALINSYIEMGLYNDSAHAYIDFIFIKGVMSCVSGLNSKGCPLKFSQKKAVIREMLRHPLVQEALLNTDDEVSYSKHVVRLLRRGNPTSIYLMGKAIFIMQFRLNSLYLNLKHRLKK